MVDVVDRHEIETRGLERVVFFSDAVFAIAITILVIDLRPPDVPQNASDSEFLLAIGALLPRVLAYALSFAIIGLYWFVHWGRFQLIERVDARLVGLNLVLLGFVALIPFPTALIGQYGDRPEGVVIYALSLSAAGFMGPISSVYATRAGLVRADLPPGYMRLSVIRGLAAPILILGSLLLLPFIGAAAVETSWLLLFPIQAVITYRVFRTIRAA